MNTEMNGGVVTTRRKSGEGMGARNRKRILFYSLMIFLPMAQTLFCYIGVNFNSFLLAFQQYKEGATGYVVSFAGLENFKVAIQFIKDTGYMIKNSFILYAVKTFIAMPLALCFSYYIYKEKKLAGFYKIVLFLPQIVSSLILSLLFRFVMTDVYSIIAQKLLGSTEPVLGLLDKSANSRFWSLLIFTVIMGFGVDILLFSGGMSGIDHSVVESAHLDGVNEIQEFIYITLPMIYPTIVSFFVIGLSDLLLNQMSLFSVYGVGATNIATFGYYLYTKATMADVMPTMTEYSLGQLSAVSVIVSLVMVPLILITKHLLQKLGPSTD